MRGASWDGGALRNGWQAQIATSQRAASFDANEARPAPKSREKGGITLSAAFQASPIAGLDDRGGEGWVVASRLTSHVSEGGLVLSRKTDTVESNYQASASRGANYNGAEHPPGGGWRSDPAASSADVAHWTAMERGGTRRTGVVVQTQGGEGSPCKCITCPQPSQVRQLTKILRPQEQIGWQDCCLGARSST